MHFVKMHGLGNDYVYLDAVRDPALERRDLPALARRMSDRHRGVGSDGIIVVCRPHASGAHVRMRIFNADGSEAETCGNGLRCLARFAYHRLGLRHLPLRVETGGGIVEVVYPTGAERAGEATVAMGTPGLDPATLPVDPTHLEPGGRPGEHAFHAADLRWSAVLVSLGNPHAVMFDRAGEPLTPATLRDLDLERLGRAIEHHPAFPRRINAHFAAVLSPHEAIVRTWERGAGETLACGSGACAVCVAGVLTGRLARRTLLHLPGGDLRVEWAESGQVRMTGPAEEVFEGTWPDDMP